MQHLCSVFLSNGCSRSLPSRHLHACHSPWVLHLPLNEAWVQRLSNCGRLWKHFYQFLSSHDVLLVCTAIVLQATSWLFCPTEWRVSKLSVRVDVLNINVLIDTHVSRVRLWSWEVLVLVLVLVKCQRGSCTLRIVAQVQLDFDFAVVALIRAVDVGYGGWGFSLGRLASGGLLGAWLLHLELVHFDPSLLRGLVLLLLLALPIAVGFDCVQFSLLQRLPHNFWAWASNSFLSLSLLRCPNRTELGSLKLRLQSNPSGHAKRPDIWLRPQLLNWRYSTRRQRVLSLFV